MNKAQFSIFFREEILPAIKDRFESDGVIDRPARREVWIDTIDGMISDGQLPRRAENWSAPW